uniref:Leucine-rich repeat serine/threonine-protein kinase 1-like n=1 Tax=Kryptolebias marmoratus TaxID=37003 RepID=A0A3Q3AM76_KRYMA
PVPPGSASPGLAWSSRDITCVCVCVCLCGRVQAVSVYWSGLQLPFLELDWFLDVCSRITHLDLSANSLAALPSVVPWGLIHLRTLDVSNNVLKELPFAENSQDVICSRLQQVILSQNQLKSLPTGLLHLIHLQKLCAAKNQLTVLFHIPASMSQLIFKVFIFSTLNSLSVLPSSVIRNKLSSFPDPWACPLKRCKASSNLLENLPDTISIFWRTQLQEVDFSDNQLKELPSYIFELEAIVSLRLSGNFISSLPAPNKWKCSQLKTLDLSRNQLGNTKFHLKNLICDPLLHGLSAVCPIEFPVLLRASLEVLLLNENQLECVPQSVCCLHNLTELYLSSNPGIRELPVELGQLPNLWQLDIEDLNITNVPPAVRNEGTVGFHTHRSGERSAGSPSRG